MEQLAERVSGALEDEVPAIYRVGVSYYEPDG